MSLQRIDVDVVERGDMMNWMYRKYNRSITSWDNLTVLKKLFVPFLGHPDRFCGYYNIKSMRTLTFSFTTLKGCKSSKNQINRQSKTLDSQILSASEKVCRLPKNYLYKWTG